MEDTVNKDKLVADIKLVLADVEELLRQASAATGDRARELREQAADRLREASGTMADLQYEALERGKRVVAAADDFVHESPWKAVGIAAAAGLLVGLLLNRR